MFKLLKKLRKKDFLLILVCAGLIVFQVWLDLKLPDYMSEITQLVQTEGNTMAEILTAAAKLPKAHKSILPPAVRISAIVFPSV